MGGTGRVALVRRGRSWRAAPGPPYRHASLWATWVLVRRHTARDTVRMEPEQRHYTSQRLKLSYVVWGDERRPPIVLVHGGRDHARNWDVVAEALLPAW